MKHKRKVPYIEQMESVECGLACFAMISSYYNLNATLSDIRKENPAPREGFSFLSLSNIANEYGFETNAYKASLEDLKNVRLPCILQWEHNHFVVLEKINKSSYQILDPNSGKFSISHEEFKEKYSEYALEIYPGEKGILTGKKGKEERIVSKYLLKHKYIFLSLIGVSILIQGLMALIPLATRWVTDNAINTANIDNLQLFGWLIIVFLFSYVIVQSARAVIIALFQKRLDESIMNDFMNKLYKLPYSFFEHRSKGDLLFRANSAIFIRDIISTSMITIFIDSLLIITYTIVMINFSVQLSMFLFLLSIFLIFFLILNTNIIRQMSKKNLLDKAKTQSVLSENIHNILDIKSLGLEKNRLNLWSEKYGAELKTTQKLNVYQSLIGTVTSLIQVGTPLVILFLGGGLYIDGKISLGTLFAFSSIAVTFITPIISIGTNYTQLISIGTYFARIKDILTAEEERVGEKEGQKLKGTIEFRNVGFKYNKHSYPVLKDVSFSIERGQKVAIVGPSGSGKSSIAKLLLGLYEASSGKIFIDGKEFSDYSLTDIRYSIGTVLQESKLFSGSIGDNVSMSKNKNKYSDGKLADAAYKAGVLDDILKTPMAFETLISENGNNFSGGQKQRLLIARALYQEPNILLFDEATSHLDMITEEHISKTLKELNITQVVIAHRLNTIVNADKIIFIEDGEVKEIGTHDELIEKKSYYYRLYFAE
ncbi:peptidase domain-containing ABC transporter [Solibacillus sp. A46]|uniref:Peptidase domain-containing ABC transporter n=1 Tax=Solibacillus faecavium TaxID=2762221 RepID=A0ABR8Y3D4_9BACL|nr:peptidase domain-containing ABC transporter [Solibacillus faecavium]MBD8038715.1 peptidase domain-containing ABC transporter [Solibacillus faecavium]